MKKERWGRRKRVVRARRLVREILRGRRKDEKGSYW